MTASTLLVVSARSAQWPLRSSGMTTYDASAIDSTSWFVSESTNQIPTTLNSVGASGLDVGGSVGLLVGAALGIAIGA